MNSESVDSDVAASTSNKGNELCSSSTDITSLSVSSPNESVIHSSHSASEADEYVCKLSYEGNRKKRIYNGSAEAGKEKKLQKQRAQEERIRQKEAERLKREKERQQREQEKKLREQEKIAAKKMKELEKLEKERIRLQEQQRRKEERDQKLREKEEAQRLRQEQILNKERQQLKLNNFFTKGVEKRIAPNENFVADKTDELNEFEKEFRPFFIKHQMSLSKYPSPNESDSFLDEVLSTSKSYPLKLNDIFTPSDAVSSANSLGVSNRNSENEVRQLMSAYQDPSVSKPQEILSCLSQIPIKFIFFYQDVRPPYFGSYTKTHSHGSNVLLNPWLEDEDIDYTYDSEAEWVADEEDDGEDLESEDEEVDNSDDIVEDGDNAFVDDEDDDKDSVNASNTHRSSGPLEVIVEGPVWDSKFLPDFNCLSLIEPISSFSASTYLQIDPKEDLWASQDTAPASSGMTIGPTSSLSDDLQVRFPSEDIPKFIEYVRNSHDNKVFLIENLRHMFPYVTKNIISETLGKVAVRKGKSVSDGWIIKENFASLLSS
ncbi:histone H3-H4 chaperone, CAF assembly factor (CAF-1) complex subunit A Pcf1 [Schizosaccharomyces pombe]|uniref:Chromatin assembly factor 1 subunit A n=1 Tax=Schizosaccharomyces pombe (strain 972 / ATCC 24843) TaxID=284812 RepID=CAF1A_SCHPO|nr:CAF assembly factor (CAF-1) complex large subunit Pcf1 [Schizosaccharomyces pombe]Q1MTN9.2 RecName: Full=Chromatin assembly factor 1 subunit rlf2 [Schizosaccharomyces pombe 972h-]CAB44771.2 CAF assembly factor (CAF-1) complex large subunit Pcf1 [Schizosaccharomyces pombe]|eukprot:NP_596048.2 CAF assembly factor (CAF-1) complex large subunit Pcf1 [Schizosaccharomyces pombe]